MDNPIKNLFAITDLRNRVLFTLGMLGVYRIGSNIPTPGINQEALAALSAQAGKSSASTTCSPATTCRT